MEEQERKKSKLTRIWRIWIAGTLVTGGIIISAVCAIKFQHSEEVNTITNRSLKFPTQQKKIKTKDDFLNELSIVFEKSYKQLEQKLKNINYVWSKFKPQVLDINGFVISGKTLLDTTSNTKIKESITEVKAFVKSKNKENFMFKTEFYKKALEKALAKMQELKLI